LFFSARFCDEDRLPPPTEDGLAIVLNTGLTFGKICSNEVFEVLTVNSGCNDVEVRLASSVGLLSSYEIKVKTPAMNQERIVAYISFSQPVDSTIVISETSVRNLIC